jgi:hypothetical protein
MQSIVKRLGDLEEREIGFHDAPLRNKAQLPHQRKQAGQDLRHSASHGRRVHHVNRRALQRNRERAQVFHFRGADDRQISIQQGRAWVPRGSDSFFGGYRIRGRH